MERSHVFEASDQAGCAGTDSRGLLVGAKRALFLNATANEVRPSDVASCPVASAPAYNSRALDIAFGLLLLIFVLPLMGICAMVVLATSRGPLLFRHARIGRDGAVFPCLKFRTMVADAENGLGDVLARSPQRRKQWETLHKLSRDPRVTPVGAFMRRYCLDELPQLFNVLAGQMSIVGPRPIVAAEIERYGEDFAVYCSVKPGLTGLWQVSGRHSMPYQERVALDTSYARSRTLAMDLGILVKTIPIVLLGLNE